MQEEEQQEEILHNNISFLNCPHCKESIPQIKLLQSNPNIILKIYCYNCHKETQKPLDEYLSFLQLLVFRFKPKCRRYSYHLPLSRKYCLECKSWVCPFCIIDHYYNKETKHHTFISHKMIEDFSCSSNIHSVNNMYCQTCNKKICQTCFKLYHDDIKHHVFYINRPSIENEVNTIKAYFNKQREINDKVKNDVIAQSNKYIGEDWRKKRNKLVEAHQRNKKKYDQLERFVDITYNSLKIMNNVEAYKLIDRIRRRCVFTMKILPDLYEGATEYNVMTMIKYYDNEHFINENNEGNWRKIWNEYWTNPSLTSFIYLCQGIIIIILDSNSIII